MNKYLVSYDLHTPRKEYNSLWYLLKSFKDSLHIQDSVWLVKSTKTQQDISELLQEVLDSDDSWIVLKFDSNISGALDDEVAKKVIELYQA
ncbi:hypothetical protein [Staphylococcus carnosus]|uniref:Uncharacterized protein n=1 Tax=Staphylococcus carnosus (strain TM300) TaxID=396513 RepID=B9DJG6_STACT|nr:hypothetical protein [Staphylococcus carnosus]QPT03561.1 hypothetical protein I6G40_10830 [Staphylococcus carnosus]UQA66284.1 hypothetical protein Sta3580_06865 [Staphylococcus carnosus]UTB78878.1 hypothetical protein A2I62_10055 [Staphylococcus carnosus]UTB88431.1 hypothetical protein A2I63_10055 [Staphylococcus carnosus]UTB90779.1 hypothetical protein A2I64_10050 [Staphylococcus carnosus]